MFYVSTSVQKQKQKLYLQFGISIYKKKNKRNGTLGTRIEDVIIKFCKFYEGQKQSFAARSYHNMITNVRRYSSKWLFLKISQISQQNTGVGVSFF